MATASVQNRNNPRQQQGQGQQQQGPAKFKSPTPVNPPPPHNRDSSNDRQENKPMWGRKNSSTTGGAATSLVNRATTPSSNHSRTNSPTPANTTANAWIGKADERGTLQAHDQFTHLLFTLTSQSVLLHTRNGRSFTGILTSFDLHPELALVLSHVLPYPLPEPAPPATKKYIVLPSEISSITATQVSLNQPNNTTTSVAFRTDTAISGTSTPTQRELEKWQPDPIPAAAMSGSLEQSGGGTWDQFATNERMFGVKSSYKEEIYTTKLDRNHPEFEKRLRQAESIAREIEGRVSTNPHLQEERNQKVDDSGMDEEDKYAGVIRNQQNPTPPTFAAAAAAAGGNKYTPPAKRAEAKTAVVAQIDPAIISSKIRTEPEKPTPVETKPPLSINSATNGTVPVVKEPEDTTPQIQEVGQKFVKEEKVKIKRARNLIGTKEKQRQFAEFAEFSNSLTLNMPVPSDLLPILAGKDAAKQKAILERNQEIKRRTEEQQKAKSPSVSSATLVSQPPSVTSPVASPGPTLPERIKAIQNPVPGSVPSPIASPTPLDPGVVKSSIVPKKLDPSAKEFVFKASAKEFKPSFAAPLSTHSPSPSRSSVVSPTPSTAPAASIRPVARGEEKSQSGFWDKKQRRDTSPKKFSTLGTFSSDKSSIPVAYNTSPAWPLYESDEQNSKGYLDVFTEGKSLPATPTSGQDDHSQSGHSYSRPSSVHPHHPTPHPPQPTLIQQQVVQGYPAGPPIYPQMGAIPVNQYPYVLSQPQQLPMHPQQALQPGFTPQLMPGQFQQHNQYPRFQQPGYQSVSPSPLMQPAIPAQYPPQQPYPNNSQFPQGYPTAHMYPGVPPYGYVPQQQNGVGFSGHPSPGRAAAAQAMAYPGMQPMNMQPQLYQDANMMRQPFQSQPQMSLRTPPQPHIPPYQGGYQHSPSRNSSYASAGHPTPSHSRRQSTQPPPEEDK